eukprot:11147779-Alexandrium_andersonii.AAC.1
MASSFSGPALSAAPPGSGQVANATAVGPEAAEAAAAAAAATARASAAPAPLTPEAPCAPE